MPSPVRRSARAAPSASGSSSSSNRQDQTLPPKSATPHSLSSEETSEPPRRSKRAQPVEIENATKRSEEVNEEAVEDDDDDGEDEEVTRCVCGQSEYPGPPLSEAFTSSQAQTEDAGGLFIQCDGCSVWQHGGCVGIVDESQSPEKYYCESCRPKQHEIHTDTNGQRYSLYLPITSKTIQQRKPSMSKSTEERKRDRADTVSRASADPVTGKRRGTIRSREHDEEAEQIQRAIEESAREAQGGRRGGKRSREESSDDVKLETKRQRRISESLPLASNAGIEDETEDEDGMKISRVKKAKAEAIQTARQAEQREKDKERERARAEAAGRRQERAGRRRGDDEDDNNATHSGSHSPPPPPSSQPGSPTAAAPEKAIARRGGPGKKVKKLGNNQYTKNRSEGAASPHNRKRLLTSGGNSSGDEQAPNSSDVAAPLGTSAAPDGPVLNAPGRGRWGKKKNVNGTALRNITSEPAERTIPNMARNLEGMMAFIQRAQLDVAEDRARYTNSGSAGASSPLVGSDMRAMELADQLTKGIRDWKEKFRGQEIVRA